MSSEKTILRVPILAALLSLIFLVPASAQVCTWDRAENGEEPNSALFAAVQLGVPEVALVPSPGSSDLNAPDTNVEGRLISGLEQAASEWATRCPQSTYGSIPTFNLDAGGSRGSADEEVRRKLIIEYKLDSEPEEDIPGVWTLAKYQYRDNRMILPGKCPKGDFPLHCEGRGKNERIDWGHPNSVIALMHELGHAYNLGHDREDGACSGVDGIMRKRNGSNRQILDAHCQLADHLLCGASDCPDDPAPSFEVSGLVPAGELGFGQKVDVSISVEVPGKAAHSLDAQSVGDGESFSFEVPDRADFTLSVDSSPADRSCSIDNDSGTIAGAPQGGRNVDCQCATCDGSTPEPLAGSCSSPEIYQVGVTGSGIEENPIQLDLFANLQLVSSMSLAQNDQLTYFPGRLSGNTNFFVRAPQHCLVSPRPNAVTCEDNTSTQVTCHCDDPFACSGDLPPRFRCPEVVELCITPPPSAGGLCVFYQRTYSVSVFNYPVYTETFFVRGWVECYFQNLDGGDAEKSASDLSGDGPTLYLRSFLDDSPVSGQVRLEGVARHDTDGVSQLRFYLDGQPFEPGGLVTGQPDAHTCSELPAAGCDPRAGFSGTIDTTALSSGEHELEIFALSGRSGTPIPSYYRTTFTVDNAPGCTSGTLPTVQITAPNDGATVEATVTVEAQADDDVGVERVTLLLDGQVVGHDSTPPYRWTWDTTTVGDGAHSLRARAYDCGGHRNSGTVDVEVDNVAPAPDLAFYQAWNGTALADGDTFVFPEPTPRGVPISRRFRIDNRGDEPLYLSNAGATVEGTCFHQIETPAAAIDPGQSTYVRARLHCGVPGTWSGAIRLVSDDPDTPTYLVHLEGEVVDTNADIALFQAWDGTAVTDGGSFVFPDPTPVGVTVSRRFRIENVGLEDLILYDAENLVSGTCFHQIETPATPIAPGDSSYVRVRLHCQQTGTFTGAVSVQSNDPDEPFYTFSVTGSVE